MRIISLPSLMMAMSVSITAQGAHLSCGRVVKDSECANVVSDFVYSPSASKVFTNIEDAQRFYRQLARDYRWRPLTGRFLISEHQHHDQIAEIRARLRLLGDYRYNHPLASPRYYDSRLKRAVVSFQRRHGLKADGIIGPNTRRALNVSPFERWQQLLVNTQRKQVDQQAQSGEYIEINIPAFQLTYFKEHKAVARMKVIVGRKERPTPVLNSAVNALELNPDWNVPRRIAHEDILPMLEEPKQFAASGVKLVKGWRRNPEVVSVDELDMQHFYKGALAEQYRFWQPPGAKNPLGQIKFIFPNRFSVYMHGTPAKSLFEHPVRAFSSGCIRLEQPDTLAQLLYARQTVRSEPQPEVEDRKTENYVEALQDTVELFIRYRTAWIDPDSGELHFRQDIYNRDPNELAQLSAVLRETDEDSVAN